jgi:hypothetical protein
MTRMNTCPQFYFHIELPIKLEWSYPILAYIWITSIIAHRVLVTI